MENHITEQLQALVGEKVAISFSDGTFVSGKLSYNMPDKTNDKGQVLYDLTSDKSIHFIFSKDSVVVINKI